MTWLEDDTAWRDPDGSFWSWTDALPSPEPPPTKDLHMEPLAEIIDLIERKLHEAEAQMNQLVKQVETLQKVKTLLKSGAVVDLLASD